MDQNNSINSVEANVDDSSDLNNQTLTRSMDAITLDKALSGGSTLKHLLIQKKGENESKDENNYQLGLDIDFHNIVGTNYQNHNIPSMTDSSKNKTFLITGKN